MGHFPFWSSTTRILEQHLQSAQLYGVSFQEIEPRRSGSVFSNCHMDHTGKTWWTRIVEWKIQFSQWFVSKCIPRVQNTLQAICAQGYAQPATNQG